MGDYRPHGFDNWGLQYEYSDNTDSFYNPEPVANSNPSMQRNVGYQQTDFLQKLFLPLKHGNDLMFNLQYSSSSRINRFDKLTERRDGKLRFAEWYYGPQDRFLFSTQFNINANKKLLDKGTFTAAYQNIKESRIERKFGTIDRSSQIEKVQVLSLNGDFTKNMNPKINRDFGYGFEVAYNDVNSKSKGEMTAHVGPVNNVVIGILEVRFVAVARHVPHENLVTFLDLLIAKNSVLVGCATHVGQWCLPTDGFRDHAGN